MYFRNSLTDFDPFGGAATKTSPQEVTDNGESDVITGTDEQDVECHEEPVFDQILDLSCEKVAGGGGESASTMAGSQVMIGAPIIAFEDANSSGTVSTAATTSIPNQVEVPTGGKRKTNRFQEEWLISHPPNDACKKSVPYIVMFNTFSSQFNMYVCLAKPGQTTYVKM